VKTTPDFIADLARMDVSLLADGSQLRVNAPQGVLTPELKRELASRKPELLAWLRSDPEEPATAPPGSIIPLSSGQARLWSLIQVRSDSRIYNVPTAYTFRGPLDVDGLKQSLSEIHRRHDALRTRIRVVNGAPRQEAPPDLPFDWVLTDLTHLADAEREGAVRKAIDGELRRPFDLGEGPPWRSRLLALGDADHVLVMIMHHIVFDRFSRNVLLRELEALYGSFSGGAKATLPPIPIQSGDFACWEQSAPRKAKAAEQLTWWKTQLGGLSSELRTPTDRPRPVVTCAEGRSETFSLSPTLSERIRQLSRAENSTPYITLLAGFHALLYRYTLQTDQVICSPFACRNTASLERIIGYINNLLPLRTNLSENPTFSGLIGRVRRTSREATSHQDAPFARIADLTPMPLTRAMFSFRSPGNERLRLKHLMATPVEARRDQADFDLALYMGDDEGRLHGVLDYNAGIFDEETIRGLLGSFETLLDTVVADSGTRLDALPFLGDEFPGVETALAAHPKIQEAAVVNRSDAKGRNCRVAYIVLNEDDVPGRTELESFCRDQLDPSEIPGTWVPVDELPRRSDGEIDLSELPPPGRSRSGPGVEFVAPRTPLEQELAHIWQRVLWQDEPVGIHDDFFDLGGHSLLSVQLFTEIERFLGRRLPQRALGKLSTIAELVRFLDEPADAGGDLVQALRKYTAAWEGERLSPESLIVGLNTTGTRQPLFWCLQRYKQLTQLALHLGGDQPLYGMRSGHKIMEKNEANIRALAGLYVGEILRWQPRGPYLVGGTCQAASIAFQIAVQLLTTGGEVTLLCMQEKFVPEEYPGRVAFFFGTESTFSPYFRFRDPEMGWSKYYSGQVEVNAIPGAHGTFFRDPHIGDLTRKLADSIERAQTGTPTVDPAHRPDALERVPRNAYCAEILTEQPLAGLPGEMVALDVTVRNLSPLLWPRSDRSGLFLGGRWIRVSRSRKSPDEWLRGDGERAALYRGGRWVNEHHVFAPGLAARLALPADVEPGGSITLRLQLSIPVDASLKTLELDMVEEGIAWFRDFGSIPLQLAVSRKSKLLAWARSRRDSDHTIEEN
jgi:acyl carrier protein